MDSNIAQFSEDRRRIPTNWDMYVSNPKSLISRLFFLNFVIRGYSNLLKPVVFDKPIEIIEFGSGTGYTNRWLCKRFNVSRLSMVDLNNRMLELSKETLASVDCRTDFINEDFFSIECDKKYDIVHSQGVIEHFEDKKRHELLRKHCASTKENGYCIIYFPVPTKSYRFFRKMAELMGLWPFTDEIPLPASVVIKEMRSLGFSEVRKNVFWKYFLTETGIIFRKA